MDLRGTWWLKCGYVEWSECGENLAFYTEFRNENGHWQWDMEESLYFGWWKCLWGVRTERIHKLYHWCYMSLIQSNPYLKQHPCSFTINNSERYMTLRIMSEPFLVSELKDSVQFSSVAQSCLTLPPHGLQQARLRCPSPTPGACSNSCPSSWWCHPTISSSIVPFSSCLQSFPASGSFQMSHSFASGGQSFGTLASASVLPKDIQDWFPLGLTGWISLQIQTLSRVLSNTTVEKHQFFSTQLSLWSNSHIHTWLLEKP